MSRELRILPECHADTLLIEILGYKKPNHQPNINDVANSMLQKYNNSLAIGIVDNDKKQPPYFKSSFEILKEQDGLILKKNPEKQHYLIVISPAFEQWIFNAAHQIEINPSDYGIGNMKYFKSITKSRKIYSNEKMKDFLNTLGQKTNSPVKLMASWIKEILGE